MHKKTKLLAIQFKYLGDAVFITPALKAMKKELPECEIHLLVPLEVVPLFSNLEWITKIWGMPRNRGKKNLSQSIPLIKKLREEHFDKSVDFGGNDRGAILSLLAGAKSRIALTEHGPSLLQRLAYTKTEKVSEMSSSWVDRHQELLKLAWNIENTHNKKLQISSNPALKNEAKAILKDHSIICHIGTSQEKKEWPIEKWHSFYKLAKDNGYKIAFSSGPNEREQNLIRSLKILDSNIHSLPKNLDLSLFLAILNESKFVISGDTGPLHFAAGLGKKVIGLFAVDDGVRHYAPIYSKSEIIIGSACTCIGDLVHFPVCKSKVPCMNSISAKQVFELLQERYPLKINDL